MNVPFRDKFIKLMPTLNEIPKVRSVSISPEFTFDLKLNYNSPRDEKVSMRLVVIYFNENKPARLSINKFNSIRNKDFRDSVVREINMIREDADNDELSVVDRNLNARMFLFFVDIVEQNYSFFG